MHTLDLTVLNAAIELERRRCGDPWDPTPLQELSNILTEYLGTVNPTNEFSTADPGFESGILHAISTAMEKPLVYVFDELLPSASLPELHACVRSLADRLTYAVEGIEDPDLAAILIRFNIGLLRKIYEHPEKRRFAA